MTFVLALIALIVVLISVVLVRSLTASSRQAEPLEIAATHWKDHPGALQQAARRVSASIRTKPITHEDVSQIDEGAFSAFFDSLATWYPAVHTVMTREQLGFHSLLFTWEGADPEAEPIVLASHIDVVPVPESSLSDWLEDPFEGVIKDGFVWGRGAIDDKSTLIGIMEAAESLIISGHRPQRTVYLAFGGDEERGGYEGAAEMARLLNGRGVRASFVLDEGLFIVDGVVPGVEAPVALVGVAEKGAANIELSVSVEGGHGSMPNDPTALGVLSRAIDRLSSKPLPATFEGVPEAMFSALAPDMSFVERTIFTNLWLFEPIVKGLLAASPSSNALIRTTVAPTMLQAGTKVNVLPSEATALLNVRIRPGDTIAGVVDQISEVVQDDRVQIRVLEGASEPSRISPLNSQELTLLSQTLRTVFPEALTAPALMIARTDSRHYDVITDNIFKITPLVMDCDDLKRVHGVNERLSIDGLGRTIQFYETLIQRASSS